MKPPLFDYYDPDTEDEALTLLGRYGHDAKILAGGQSLMPLMNMRLVTPAHLIDLNRVESLAYIRVGQDALHIGAMTRQRQTEISPDVARLCPLLREAIGWVGYTQIRHRGTLGGSLAHADPAAELPAVMAALDARFEVRSQRGVRFMECDEFFLTYMATALEPDELLCDIRLPLQPAGTGACFLEVCRVAGAFAIVGAAALLSLDEAGRCVQARLAFTGVGEGPQRAHAVETALIGAGLDAKLIQQVAATADQDLDPPDDVHASAAYRRNLVRILAQRTLLNAWQRARDDRL